MLFFLPGTFIHELSHFLMAKVLFVPVGKFNLVPKRGEKEIVLGSVAIAKVDIVRRLIIGAAPVIFGITLVLSVVYISVSQSVYKDWRLVALIGYIVFITGNSMFSSKKDLEGAWKVALFAIIITTIFYLLGLRIHLDINSEIFQLASLYLLPAIAIDGCILAVLSLVRRPRS